MYSSPRVAAVARKTSGNSAKSAGDGLQLNNLRTLTQPSRSVLTMLSRHGVGENSSHLTRQGTLVHGRISSLILAQSSQLAEPLWTDPGVKSGTSVRELIFPVKKKKKNAGRE